MSTLKAELRGETLPEFTMTLPTGWIKQEPNDEARRAMVAAAKQRLMAVHRPDLFAQTTAMVEKVFQEMRRVDTVAFFGPGVDAPDSAYLPVSLTASVRRGQGGASLDDTVAQLIRREGATALGADKRFLRWRRESVESIDAATVATTTVAYFTPVPDSGRTRALQLTLVISHDPIAEGDAEFVDSLVDVFDAHVSTFAWIPA